MNIKTLAHAYFNKNRPSFLATLVTLLGMLVFGVLTIDFPAVGDLLVLAMYYAWVLAMAGMLAVAIGFLVRKQWENGVRQLLMIPMALIAFVIVMVTISGAGLFGASSDGFADDLVIPLGIEIAEPLAQMSDPEVSGNISKGLPSLELFASDFGGGIYDITTRVNPGEPGSIYLKAYEVTKNTPLTARRLKRDTRETIGWSNDPEEMFQTTQHITIYEGDWGQYYAARFEVWFTPEDGSADRKLYEKVYLTEGWQR